jgi:ABC-type Zn uptake system ZnuABC Zn-binding protein ZnuA
MMGDLRPDPCRSLAVKRFDRYLEIICKNKDRQASAEGNLTTIRRLGRRAAGAAALGCLAASLCGASSRPLHVVSTISTLASFVRAVGGDAVVVDSLVPIGSGPEDYQPTPADITNLHDADVLVENGTHLETWLDRTIENASNPHLRVVVLSDGLQKKGADPHLWMDPELARAYVRKIRDALSAADPAHRAAYARNAAAYDRTLLALEREIKQRIATIPPRQRTMIVFHNAWQYYDDRFGLRTAGILELSPGQEPNPRQIADLVALAQRERVRAIFSEPEYSPKLMRALAESAGISVVENLYDDSLSQDARAKDYVTMLRYDTNVIVRSLGGR